MQSNIYIVNIIAILLMLLKILILGLLGNDNVSDMRENIILSVKFFMEKS